MSLKSIFKKLQKFQKSVEVEIINRENYLSDRSEEWLESVKGDDYIADTEILQELNDALNEGLINLHHKTII